MTMRHLFIIPLVILLFGVQGAIAASIDISPAGNGTFIIQGSGMDGVAGIQLIVTYDKSSLASPSVTQGSLVSGAMMAANTNNPGSINIAIINTKPFSGSGQVATITFGTHTGNGSITVSSSMINGAGAALPGGKGMASASDYQTSTAGSSGTITTPGVPFSQPTASSGSTGSSSSSTAPAPTATTYVGSVTTPADGQTRNSDQPRNTATKQSETPAVPEQSTEPAAGRQEESAAELPPVVEPKKADKIKVTTYAGILDLFRTYKGERSPAIFTALFSNEISPAIHQEPAVVLSDGTTPVKILVKLAASGDRSPNFSLNGAKLLSLKKGDPSTWIVEALPKAGVMQATLTILTEGDLIEYPLTLAPVVAGVSSADTEFAVFLADPKRDLNGDGRHDYQDDFVYTANFLIKKGTGGDIKK